MGDRTFENFPDTDKCPLCGTNENKECCLVPIDGTTNDNICEAQPIHVECIKEISMFRYNKEHNLLYRVGK